MRDTYFYFHAGSKNHGCEAIVRATQKLIGGKPCLISAEPEEDLLYDIDKIAAIQAKPEFTQSFAERLACSFTVRLLKSDRYGYHLRAKSEVRDLRSGSVALSIGGDNYCYGAAYNFYLEGMNQQLHKRGIKTVLWGCSIEPDTVTDAMRKDFARYDLIVARESISYELLKACNPNTVLACDPAFMLDKEELLLPDGFIPGKTVGVNLSPLIQKSEKIKGITSENYRRMIRHILDTTEYNIALIPHVVCRGNDDRDAMQPLFDEFKGSGRICMISDGTCEQLKGYIARCQLFVGARTHATIAAYSSGVPTLVVGYSTKAKGIARDLFGTDEQYVLPVQSLETPEDMTMAFDWLNVHSDRIEKVLQQKMPAYRQTIRQAAAAVKNL